MAWGPRITLPVLHWPVLSSDVLCWPLLASAVLLVSAPLHPWEGKKGLNGLAARRLHHRMISKLIYCVRPPDSRFGLPRTCQGSLQDALRESKLLAVSGRRGFSV